MALLHIAEPGLSAAPHQHKWAVGIDLGTTNSLVAVVRSASAETLADEQGPLNSRHMSEGRTLHQQLLAVVGAKIAHPLGELLYLRLPVRWKGLQERDQVGGAHDIHGAGKDARREG